MNNLQTVKTYRNLNNGKISIQVNGIIIGHADSVLLDNPTFKVSEAGRMRVLKEKRKNVHAFVIGQLKAVKNFTAFKGRQLPAFVHSDMTIKGELTAITYNPYKYSQFVTRESEQTANNYNFESVLVSKNGAIIAA